METSLIPNHRRDNLLIIFSSLGILGLLIRGGYLVVTGINNFDPKNVPNLASNMLEALAMLFSAGLLVPMLVYSIRRLQGKEIPPARIKPIRFWQVMVLIAAWVLALAIATVLDSAFSYGWAIAAPFFLLGIFLPILCLLWVATGGIPAGSRRRLWSVFGSGLAGSTVAAILAEYLVIGAAILGIGALAISNPELRTVINQVRVQVANAKAGDMQTLITGLAPYLTNPLIMLSILVFASGLTPMIEEAAKPAVLWFMGKRLRSPAEGFVLGALCGAGFALLEGLMAASGATQLLGVGLAGRAAASLMHISGSGILGWGIASATLEKRYGRLALAYVTSVSIHGLWNGAALMAVYGSLRMVTMNTFQLDVPGALFVVAGAGMLILELAFMLTALPLINRALRKSFPLATQPASNSDIIAPISSSIPRENNDLDTKSN
jgi:RsiW-degrading membrane proteinase PrsW (M82 family)